MLGRLNGFFSGNSREMFIVTWTLPYIYDYFLERDYVDTPTFNRLMEYYEFVRRFLLNIKGNDLWKYKSLYKWKKPSYLSETTYKQEETLFLNSIAWTSEEAKKEINAYKATLPELPSYVEPPIEPSPLERVINRQNDGGSFGKIGGGVSNIGSTRKLRKKKTRKKKHKDNRKRGQRSGRSNNRL